MPTHMHHVFLNNLEHAYIYARYTSLPYILSKLNQNKHEGKGEAEVTKIQPSFSFLFPFFIFFPFLVCESL